MSGGGAETLKVSVQGDPHTHLEGCVPKHGQTFFFFYYMPTLMDTALGTRLLLNIYRRVNTEYSRTSIIRPSIIHLTMTRTKLMTPSRSSRALSPCEKNYGITDLEILAVVWALSHFKCTCMVKSSQIIRYIVKPVLFNPNACGKHARWWA